MQKKQLTAEALQKLTDLEHVRERPSMYIGDTTERGLHHLVYEVVGNSIDEAMAGFAKTLKVTINKDGSVTVEDDGRGISVEKHEELSTELSRDISILEGVMTFLKFGGKFEKSAYQTSGGLHGVGVTVVNFLSEWCECQVSRDGHLYLQRYERGIPQGPVTPVGATESVGTKTTFKPDDEIFKTTEFTYDTLRKRLQILAFLNQGMKIICRDERSGQGEEFCYERGVIEFVEYLNRDSEVLHGDIIHIQGEADAAGGSVSYEIAMQYSLESTENLYSYVLNIQMREGGTHVSGFLSAIARTLNSYGCKEDLFEEVTPANDDFREGLTAVISMHLSHPQFQGSTKTRLGNDEVEGIVDAAVTSALGRYFEENPTAAKSIVRKGILAAQAREASLACE